MLIKKLLVKPTRSMIIYNINFMTSQKKTTFYPVLMTTFHLLQLQLMRFISFCSIRKYCAVEEWIKILQYTNTWTTFTYKAAYNIRICMHVKYKILIMKKTITGRI